MKWLPIVVASLVIILGGVYTFSQQDQYSPQSGIVLNEEELSSYFPDGVACTKMACLCDADGDRDCNSCSSVGENRCAIREVVECKDGEQTGTSYRIESCE